MKGISILDRAGVHMDTATRTRLPKGIAQRERVYAHARRYLTEGGMMGRRMITGYAPMTMAHRLQEMIEESRLMGQDGRLREDDACRVEVGLLLVHRMVVNAAGR